MEKSKCLNGPALEAFISARREGSPMPGVKQHLEGCRRCSLLVEVASKTMPKSLLADAKRVNAMLGQPSPEKVEPGQIWRLDLQPDAGPYPVGVVTRGPGMLIDRDSPDIRLSRINFEARMEEIAPDDVVVEKLESPMGLRCLIEHWNDRPVSVSLLERYLGRLGRAALKRLQAALADLGPAISLAPAVRAFRERCIQEASPLSQESLQKAGRFLESRATTSSAPPIGRSKPPARMKRVNKPMADMVFGCFIPLPANELVRGAAASKKKETAFELWRRELLERNWKGTLNLPAQPRETPGGIRFRVDKEEQNILLQVLGKQGKVLKEVHSENGFILLLEKGDFDWKQVTGIRFEKVLRLKR